MDWHVTVKFDKNAVKAKIQGAGKKAVFITSQQALKDCNYYCKQDQDGLIDSSLTHSIPEDGLLVWSTPYAKRQYYLASARHDKNPNATMMWAHKAHSQHGHEWQEVFQKALTEEMRKR